MTGQVALLAGSDYTTLSKRTYAAQELGGDSEAMPRGLGGQRKVGACRRQETVAAGRLYVHKRHGFNHYPSHCLAATAPALRYFHTAFKL
jgi:hypothetical protein